MEAQKAKAIYQTYKRQIQVLAVIAIALYLVFYYFNTGGWLVVALTLPYLVLIKSLGLYLYNKHINSILTDDMDPVLFRAVIEEGKLISSGATERLGAAYYNQEYQTVIDICTLKMKDPKCKRYRFHYLNYLARTYFDLGDKEKLREVCDYAENAICSAKNADQLREKYPLFQFFSLYLSENYASCRALYETVLQDKRLQSKWQQVHGRFTYAIACYCCGDHERAKQNFSHVIETAPKLHMAETSRKYLDAMEAGAAYEPEYRELLPTENFSIPLYEEKRKKMRKPMIIYLCVVVVIVGVMTWLTPSGSRRVYAKISDAIEPAYEDFEIVRAFNITQGDETSGYICLIDTEQDGLVFGSLHPSSREGQYTFEARVLDVQVGEEYSAVFGMGYGFFYEHCVDFALFEHEDDIPSDAPYRTVEIEVDGKDYVFGMTDFYRG